MSILGKTKQESFDTNIGSRQIEKVDFKEVKILRFKFKKATLDLEFFKTNVTTTT